MILPKDNLKALGSRLWIREHSIKNGFDKHWQFDDNIDCIVWTFTQRETLRRNPAAWGWINLDDDGITIKNVSVKIPVSEDPYNDHAVVASFYFKKAKDFIEATNLMIKEDYRIRDEFYVDSIPLFLNKLGKRSVIFDVDLYVCWGTPEDLKDYQKWERICNKNEIIVDLSEEDKKLLNLFEDYFRKGASS